MDFPRYPAVGGKGIQILKAMGIGITELTPPMTYSNPNLPDTVVTDINNALNMGRKVIVPEDTGGLPAVPYIKYDPNTGSAGYMIAGKAGGYLGNLDASVDLLNLISYWISYGGQRSLIGLDFAITAPVSGLTVILGDGFDAGVKMIAKWQEGAREWTEEYVDPKSMLRVQTRDVMGSGLTIDI